MNQNLQPNLQIAEPTRDETIDFGAIFFSLWRGKFFIAMLAVVAALIGGYYAYSVATPLYRATTVVILETREESVVSLESVVGGLSGDTSAVNSEVEVLKSRSLLGKVVDRLDLTQNPEFNAALRAPDFQARMRGRVQSFFASLADLPNADLSSPGAEAAPPPAPEPVLVDSQRRARDRAINALLGKLGIRNVPQTVVFQISVTSENPATAAEIADVLAELYVLNQIEVKFEATEQATSWLTNRVTDLQSQLELSESRVKSFSAGTDLISPETLAALERQLKDLRDRITNTERTRQSAEAKLSALQAAQTPQAQAELSEDLQLQQLAPRIDTPNIREAFDTRFAAVLTRAELDIARAANQIQALAASEVTLETQIAAQGRDLIELQQLSREAEANRLLYEYFLGRLKETSAQQGIQQADSRVLSRAVVPGAPTEPRKSRILAFSTMIGVLLGIGLVLLREARQNAFRTARDLETTTRLTVMGQIPLLPARRRRETIAYLARRPTSAAAEAIRNLRTSVMLSNVDNPPQVIAVTSSIPGEGKTTLSLSLAMNFVGMNRKVLLIEGDIRRRVFRQYLGTRQKTGLLSVISGKAEIEETVIRYDKVGADILIGEKSSVSATDLFASESFTKTIARAREIYDTIIIDTPPVLVVPDARVIAQQADALLFVVKWDKTSRPQVEEALHMFSSIGQRVHGLVLNQISPRGMKRYGYGGKYGAYSSYGRKYYTN